MKLVHAERNGEAFDSQLVIGVRESYGEWECNLVSFVRGTPLWSPCVTHKQSKFKKNYISLLPTF